MIYENIKTLCKTKGISINKLEEIAGIGNGTIGGWKTGHPSLRTLEKISKALDVPVEELIRR